MAARAARRLGQVSAALPQRTDPSPVYGQSPLMAADAIFLKQNRQLPRLAGRLRQPVFLASWGIIHYRNERLQPESEPSES